jgi:uncharacterized integral membrane protein
MKYYKLWALALFLKVVGSSWDASYHFKYFFEEYSLPHIVNFIGFALGGLLLIQEYRNLQYLTLTARTWITIGYILFIIGIPLDFTYHLLRGIDLTTWSPTHFIYYLATGVMIYGVWRGYYHFDPSPPNWRSLHTLWAFFIIEALWFPCMQQENGAISLFEYLHHQSIASKEILELIKDPKSQIFGGVPDWVYPVYGSSVLILFAMIHRKLFSDMQIIIAATAGYIVYRYMVKFIFHLVAYPTSFVPIMAICIPIVIFISPRKSVISCIVAGLSFFLVLFAIQTTKLAITPPITWNMYGLVFIANILSYYVAELLIDLYKKGLSRPKREAII